MSKTRVLWALAAAGAVAYACGGTTTHIDFAYVRPDTGDIQTVVEQRAAVDRGRVGEDDGRRPAGDRIGRRPGRDADQRQVVGWGEHSKVGHGVNEHTFTSDARRLS